MDSGVTSTCDISFLAFWRFVFNYYGLGMLKAARRDREGKRGGGGARFESRFGFGFVLFWDFFCLACFDP